jgi:membrane-associated phospholipid phosphatase
VSAPPERLPPGSPKTRETKPWARRAALPGELVIVAILVFCYDRVRDFADVRRSLSFHDAYKLLRIERHLGINRELPVNVWLATHHELAEFASWYYQVAHLTVTLLVLLACYVYWPEIYRAARNALVLINVIGLVVFWVYPVAPPRLLPGGTFIDVTEMTGVAGATNTSAPNPYAAMPSLHTAWAVWVSVVVLLMVRAWWVRVVCVVYPLLTVAVIVSTGNHYILDAVAGATVALVSCAAVGLLPLRSRQHALPATRRSGSEAATAS